MLSLRDSIELIEDDFGDDDWLVKLDVEDSPAVLDHGWYKYVVWRKTTRARVTTNVS